MARARLYVAQSLDGYIADADGGVGWLDAFHGAGTDYGYAAFLASVGALAMGRATYEQVRGFGAWPYAKPTFVFARRRLPDPPPGVRATDADPTAFLAEQQEDVWLVGGAALVRSFRKAGALDEIVLTILPVLLGDGLPLFDGPQPPADLALVSSDSFPGGAVQLTYRLER